MCGLVGIMTTNAAADRHLNLFATMLFLDQARGQHATGIAKINPWTKGIEIIKKAKSATYFLGDEDVDEFLEKARGRIYIGHNRFATIGDKTKDENAHPFQVDHITLAHNGSVDKWTMKNLEGHDDPEIVVDSHMVCKTIADLGIDEAIKKFSGAFALTWWDNKEMTLNFLRNADRPLWIAKMPDGTVLWASEREFMDAMVLRKKGHMSYSQEPTELPVDRLVQFRFNNHGVLQDNGKPLIRDMKFTKVADPDPKPLYGNHGSSRGWRAGFSDLPLTTSALDHKANELMRLWKLDNKINDRIQMKVVRLEECNNHATRVNVHMEYQGFDAVCFYVERSVVDGAKMMSGVITNFHEMTVKSEIVGGCDYVEPRFIISSANFNRTFETIPRPKHSARPTAITAIGPRFPLKAQGHTFKSREEFTDFVGQGCAQCGQVPASYDPNNVLLTVYEKPGFCGLLSGCDFVCGQCIAEDNKQEKK